MKGVKIAALLILAAIVCRPMTAMAAEPGHKDKDSVADTQVAEAQIAEIASGTTAEQTMSTMQGFHLPLWVEIALFAVLGTVSTVLLSRHNRMEKEEPYPNLL